MFKKYSHPMLYVTDLARAVDWYKSKLGFKENFVAPNAKKWDSEGNALGIEEARK